jgi:predicted nucleic acid-binding protein
VKETVYIETSILGYLTARSTDNLILAANMKITQDWWFNRSSLFDLYISEIVLEEITQGDTQIAQKRLNAVQNIPLLSVDEKALSLAEQFLLKSNLPVKAGTDAVHIAIATIHNMNYLLTWNCKHIANAQIQKKLTQISLEFGYEMPTICTPYELIGE